MAANSHAELEQSNLTFDQMGKECLTFVFQCKGCNNIIGDSSGFASADQELEVICVKAVTSLVISQECLETSTEGPDMGSTFRPLQCTSCKSLIGRVYRTTPKEFDHLRALFCLEVEHIKSYQVGSASETQNLSLTSEQILDIPTAKTLEDRIIKIECVILMLMERMGLEDTANKENDSTISTNQTVGNKMDCQVTAQDKDSDKESTKNKPSKKKRK